jgi:hypothetical protein
MYVNKVLSISLLLIQKTEEAHFLDIKTSKGTRIVNGKSAGGRGQNSSRIKKNLVSDSALSREKKFVLLKKEKQSMKTEKRKKNPS